MRGRSMKLEITMKHRLHCILLAALALGVGLAQADTGKLLLTGGVSTIGGSAGGGLTPWAVIGTNATAGEVGYSGYVTRAATQDYSLNGYGVAVGTTGAVLMTIGLLLARPGTARVRVEEATPV